MQNILASLVAGNLSLLVHADQEHLILIHYHERPPYHITIENGTVIGSLAVKTERAFRLSGIPYRWVKSPAKRQLKYLQKNQNRICLSGWFKNKKREKFALFSRPIQQVGPIIGVAMLSNTRIKSNKSIESTFADNSLILLTKIGYSYGNYTDDLIKKLNPNRKLVSVENINMLNMIKSARADYMLTTEEEADSMLQQHNFSKSNYKYIRFKNMPYGNKRYILCSLIVGSGVIERLNQWIPPLN